MPVPGLNPELPLRAKVRVGAKVEREIKGRTKALPTAVDHFLCDDDTFQRIAGDKPTTLRIHFPYQGVDLAFPSGLERWVKGRSGEILTCYTKGDGVAHRLTKGEKAPDGTWKMDPTVLADRKIEIKRRDMPCAAQKCAFFGKGQHQGCRPQARLCFQLVGGPRDSVYKFETKGLGSIEGITGVLAQYEDLRGIEFDLSVEIVKKGNKEFPVVSIQEVTPPLAPSAPEVEAAPSGGVTAPSQDGAAASREQLKSYLVETGRWPLAAAQIDWVLSVGPDEALRILKEKDAA